MIVFLNGSFGIGKTSAAKALHALLPGSRIYDPEVIGFYLRRMPHWIPLTNRETGDYQDMPAWRRWAVRGMRLARMRGDPVIVPMAFTNLAYLNEFRDGARRIDPDVRHFCLIAPLEVVLARSAARGGSARDAAGEGGGVLRGAQERGLRGADRCGGGEARADRARHRAGAADAGYFAAGSSMIFATTASQRAFSDIG